MLTLLDLFLVYKVGFPFEASCVFIIFDTVPSTNTYALDRHPSVVRYSAVVTVRAAVAG